MNKFKIQISKDQTKFKCKYLNNFFSSRHCESPDPSGAGERSNLSDPGKIASVASLPRNDEEAVIDFKFNALRLFGSLDFEILNLRSTLKTALIAVVGIFIYAALPSSVHAATVQFNPVNGTVGLGETAEVQVTVSSSTPVTAVDVTVGFSIDKVLAVEANSSGTNFPIMVFPGQVDNSQGTAHYIVSSPNPGYTGSNGVIGTIVFRGAALGVANLTVKSAKIVNGADGSDVYTGSTPGTLTVDTSVKPKYTVTGEQGPVPIVNSTSHPDPSKWYSNRNVSFTWTGGSEYNYVFDQSPDTLPPPSSKGPATTTTINGVGDGVWYFHVRATNSDGLWGPTSTFKVQIDGTNPGAFNLKLDPANDPSALPLISFEAPDTTSGIDHYELSLDDGTYVTVPSPYQLPQVKAGQHTVTVKAFDKAGNVTSASANLNLSPLAPAPKITSPGDNFSLALGGGQLSGTGPAGASIQLYANDQYITSVTAGKDGKWTITLENQPPAGKYTFKVKAAMPNHLDSDFSNSISGNLAAAGLSFGGISIGGYKFGQFAIPAWMLIVIYVILLILLLLVLGYLFYRWQKARQDQKLALQKLELMTEAEPAASPIPTDVGQSTAPAGEATSAAVGAQPTSPPAETK